MIPGDPDALDRAADTIETAARDLADVADNVGTHGRRVTSFWLGSASDAAGDHIQTLSRRADDGAQALAAVPSILRTFADQLRTAQREYAYAESTAQAQSSALHTAQAAHLSASGLPQTDPTRADALTQTMSAADAAEDGVREAHAAMAAAVTYAEQANAAAAALVDAVTERLADMGPGTTTSTTSTGAWPWGAARSGWPLDEYAAVGAEVPWGAEPGSTAQLRVGLARLDSAHLTAYLESHPAEARRLVDSPDLPPELAGRMVAGFVIRSHQDVDQTAAAFSAMSPERAAQVALLYPSVVGGRDGAPVAARVAANRIKVVVALDDERATLATAREVLRRTPPEAQVPAARKEQHSAKRVETFENLLNEMVDDPARRGSGGPLHHQVLVFDAAGDGKIAELWGSIDDTTRHVAVLVPGTTTDITTFAETSEKARRLTKADTDHGIAAVAWADLDLPDTVPVAAGRGYAYQGAQPLSDFTVGLRVPKTADTTVIGHSYGAAVVGQADHLGLRADRIVMVEPGGAGPDVATAADFDTGQNSDVGTAVTRYTMTAPGDLIGAAQGLNGLGLGLGADPDTLDGMVQLETGRYHDMPGDPGKLVSGLAAHSGVFKDGSTSWNNIVAVVQEQPVVPYTPPTLISAPSPLGPVPMWDYPYSHPSYNTAPIPVPPPTR